MPATQTTEIVKFEYVPMSEHFTGIDGDWNLTEGVGATSTGGLHGSVIINDYSPNKVTVFVFADTAARKISNTSWRQVSIAIYKGEQLLNRREAHRENSHYVISENSLDTYMGSEEFTLPEPTDLTPLTVHIVAILPTYLPGGTVPRPPILKRIKIYVRKAM